MSERPWNVLYSGTTLAGCSTSFFHVLNRTRGSAAAYGSFSRPVEPVELEWVRREHACRVRVLQEYYSSLYVPDLREALHERTAPAHNPLSHAVAIWNRFVPYWRALAAFLPHVDGVVLVVDSQVERFEANAERVERLQRTLRDLGSDPAKVSLVFQLNKRDTPSAADVATLRAALRWPGGAEYVESVATRGEGTAEALDALVARLRGRAR